MEEMFYQLLQRMKELAEQLQEQSERLQQQSEQLQEQSEQLTALQEIIATKDAQIAALTAKIEELTHKKNSGNSSKPPSSERLNKPAPKSLRTKSGKPAGGQPGHKGSGMKIDRDPDEVIEHRPAQCEGCPHAATCKLRCCETRYEYEAVVETKLIAHKVLGCKACTLTGEAVQGTFPSNITGAKQYGPGIAGLAVSLLVNGYMSVDRVQKLLRGLRIPISSGAIQDMLTKAAKLVQAPVERIRQTVTQLPVAHYDETGWRVAGKLHWLHCACDEQWRYYTVQEKRGQEGITDMGVLPNASGVAVHDFWKPYQKYDNVNHAIANSDYLIGHYDTEGNLVYYFYGAPEVATLSFDLNVQIIGAKPASKPVEPEQNDQQPDSDGFIPIVNQDESTENKTSNQTSSTPAAVTSDPAPAPTEPITIAKAPASTKAKAGKKGKVTVSWKKIKKSKKTKALLGQIKSVQVQYSTDPNFAADVVTKTVSKKKTKLNLKLQKKTTYYIRVRYVGADGVSDWGAVKKVTTKK